MCKMFVRHRPYEATTISASVVLTSNLYVLNQGKFFTSGFLIFVEK